MNKYPPETLNENDDDGTMVESLAELTQAVVGHKIVSIEDNVAIPAKYYGTAHAPVITLDDGTRVALVGGGGCCAYTEVEAFLLHPERVDHVITGVGTTGEYTTWHIYADMGDVLELTVGWSCGNPFYYGYGFDIRVLPISESVSV